MVINFCCLVDIYSIKCILKFCSLLFVMLFREIMCMLRLWYIMNEKEKKRNLISCRLLFNVKDLLNMYEVISYFVVF